MCVRVQILAHRSADEAVLESCDMLRRWSFVGGSEFLDAGFEVSYSGSSTS